MTLMKMMNIKKNIIFIINLILEKMKELIRMNQIAGTITEGQAKRMLAILNEEEQIDMFDAITVDKDMSVKDAYTKFLMNFARTAGEESPEKLSPNELDKKYTGEIKRKYKITSPFTFSNMGIDLETKGLIKRK